MSDERTPEEVAAELTPKLVRRLRLCAHSAVSWEDAPKSHRQLGKLRLVHEGLFEGEAVALATDRGRLVLAALPKEDS